MNYIYKYQLEIRYERIFRFPFLIREIADKFYKLFVNIGVANKLNFNESIVFQLAEYNTSIECMFDRIIFISEGSIEDFTKKNLIHNKLFYDIFIQITKSEYFKRITNILLVTEGISTINKDINIIKKNFFKNFYTDNCTKIMPDVNDYSITIDSGNDTEKLKSLAFGPYSFDDISKRAIPYTKLFSQHISKEDVGLMFIYKYFEVRSEFNFDLQKKIMQELLTYKNNVLKIID